MNHGSLCACVECELRVSKRTVVQLRQELHSAQRALANWVIENCAICGQSEGAYEHRAFNCTNCGDSYTNDEQGHANENARDEALRRAAAKKSGGGT